MIHPTFTQLLQHQISVINKINLGLATLEEDYLGVNSWVTAVSLTLIIALFTYLASETTESLSRNPLSRKQREQLKKNQLYIKRHRKLATMLEYD